MTFKFAVAALAMAGGLTLVAQPAAALTMQECSALYNTAKGNNSLGTMSWNDFRKAKCGDTAAPAVAPSPANPPSPAARGNTARPAPLPASNAVFPRSLDRKYSAETPSKQRMKTCLDQYNINKTNGGNADLKWIQKGGGYYSQCNARMKQIQGV